MEKCRRLPAAIAYFALPRFSSRAKYSGANGRGSTSANGARSKCDFSARDRAVKNGLAADAISTDRRAVFRRLGRIQLVTANAGDCRNADVPCMRVVIAHRISSLSKMSTSSSTRIIFLARNRSPAPAARPAPAGLHRRVDVFHLQDPEELTATRGVGVDIL